MGNSYQTADTAYGFGQYGSATVQTATPIIPPQGMVIVAIQFLADNILLQLESENSDTTGPQFINTVTAANFEGVTVSQDSTMTAETVAAGSDITITANTAVKVGQYVLLVDDEATGDSGLGTAATGADDGIDSTTKTPVYNGANKQGTKVVSVNTAGTTITLSESITFDNTQHLVFLDQHHGAGGNIASGINYPKGLTIVGRWTKVRPTADANGGIIAYFGY
jgi:hypothetical protein